MVHRKLLVQKLSKIMRNPRFKWLTTDAGTNLESNVKQRLFSGPPNAMKQYFTDRGLLHILEQTPAIYTRTKPNCRYCILGDPKVARRIAYEICSRLEGKYVIECDPGFGFASDVLATIVPHLRLCEPNEELRLKLQEFKLKFPGKVDIFDFNFQHLQFFLVSKEEFCLNKLYQFFENLSESSVTEINLTFICTIMQLQTVEVLCKKMVCNEFFQKFGRWEYYWLIPCNVYEKLIASPENEFSDLYSYVAVLFQTIFDYDVLLDHLPRNVFLPWTKNKSEDYILLTKVVPKLEFLNLFNNEDLFTKFAVFLKDNVRPQKKVIAHLESYVPECGPDFIFDFDLTNYTEFLELTPKKLLAMFLLLLRFPDFLSSNTFNDNVDEMNNESDCESKGRDDEENSTIEEINDEQNYQLM